MPDIYQKSGYLNSPFRLFYLEDLPGGNIPITIMTFTNC